MRMRELGDRTPDEVRWFFALVGLIVVLGAGVLSVTVVTLLQSE